MKRSVGQQAKTRRRGAVTVEFAMVFPVILLMFTGSIEMASLHYARHSMGYAAYEAARKAAIPGSTPAIGQNAGMQHLNLVGLGTGAQVTVTQNSTAVTAEVRIPSSNFSWGPISYLANFIAVERCTLLRE
ncbi:MAG: TadE/TadG family type IV pilus assembly protein [Planctomycetaceae bacterium]